MATAAKTTVVEGEQLVEPGEIDPDHIITPGIYVKRIVKLDRPTSASSSARCRKRAEMTEATAFEFEPPKA